MVNFRVVTVVENNLNMLWNIISFLENLQEKGWSSKTDVLIYTPQRISPIEQWDDVFDMYPEVNFEIYEGNVTTKNLSTAYISIIRPFCLSNYLTIHPEYTKIPLVYTDSDILFTSVDEISTLFEDNISYMSSTISRSDYMSYKYIESKEKDVDEERLEHWKKLDVLKRLADIHGISKQDIIDSYDNTGGVQYILKNTTPEFWEKVMYDCFTLKVEWSVLNQNYFKGKTAIERENKGLQSWCADLFSVLYNLIYFKIPFKTSPLLEFAWATDPVSILENVYIIHNAGVTSENMLKTLEKDENGKHIEVEAPAFYKNQYGHNKHTPFKDVFHLKKVAFHPVSSQYCTGLYAKHLLNIQEKYQINY